MHEYDIERAARHLDDIGVDLEFGPAPTGARPGVVSTLVRPSTSVRGRLIVHEPDLAIAGDAWRLRAIVKQRQQLGPCAWPENIPPRARAQESVTPRH